MSDFLIELGQNPRARRLVKTLGLPIPLPEKLRRAAGPWQERPLHDATAVVVCPPGAMLGPVIARTLARAGANPLLVDADDAAVAIFREAGEPHGRLPTVANVEADKPRPQLLLLDASGITDLGGLRALYDFFHPWAPKLARSGRIVVLARPAALQFSAAAAAAQQATDGFVRSLAKEVGKQGGTANLVTVEPGAEARLEAVLRWLLSPRSAFVSGQPLHVSAVAAAPAAQPETHVLEGKVALVTGAARGIGRATAKLLGAEGAHVVCLDRPADDGPVSQIAREVGGSVLLCDLGEPGAAATICEALGERGVDVVVHNAGVTRDKTLARMKPEAWDQTLAVNLGAVASVTDALLGGPLREGGRIVCLTSVAGISGNLGQTNYTASKAGIIGLVRYLAPTVAARGITVNAVAPGFIETRLTAAIPVMIREVGRRLNNLGQGGLPQDVAELITFLASPGACGITGSVVRVCGGAILGA